MRCDSVHSLSGLPRRFCGCGRVRLHFYLFIYFLKKAFKQNAVGALFGEKNLLRKHCTPQLSLVSKYSLLICWLADAN